MPGLQFFNILHRTLTHCNPSSSVSICIFSPTHSLSQSPTVRLTAGCVLAGWERGWWGEIDTPEVYALPGDTIAPMPSAFTPPLSLPPFPAPLSPRLRGQGRAGSLTDSMDNYFKEPRSASKDALSSVIFMKGSRRSAVHPKARR